MIFLSEFVVNQVHSGRDFYRHTLRNAGIEKIIMLAIIGMCAVISTMAADAPRKNANLMFNSSFELGDKGWTYFHGAPAGSGVIDFTNEGMVTDADVSRFGAHSLRITGFKDQNTTVNSCQIELSPGKKYTFSFWAKSDVDKRNLPIGLSAASRDGKYYDSQTAGFSLGTEWKRYSYSFSPKAGNRYYMLSFRTDMKSPGSFWLDGLQLEEGGMSEYHPAADIETAVYAPEKIVGTDEIKGRLCAIAYDTPHSGKTVKVTIFDGMLERQTAEQELRLDLPAGRAVNCDFTFAGVRFGGMRIHTAPGSFGSSAFFLRLHDLPENSAAGFKVGGQGNLLARTTGGLGWPGAMVFDTYGTPESRVQMGVLQGGLFRAWSTDFSWRSINPEPGKFVWDRSDRVVAEAEKNRLELEFTLTANFACESSNGGYLPDWVRQRDRGEKPGQTLLAPCIFKTYLPQLEDWRKYVRAVAERYRGRIAYYDVMNEPNPGFPPANYLEYLKAAYEEIKKADPSAKVVGMSFTEDFGIIESGFIGGVLRLGGGHFMDVISFHPYHSRNDDSAMNAMARIREIRKIMSDFGVEKPLWNDECYYLNGIRDANYKLAGIVNSGAISRRLLIDMGEGLGASCPLQPNYEDPTMPDFFYYGDWTRRMKPSEIFAEQNAVAAFIKGAMPLRTFELPGEILCYLFKNNDRLLAAIWSKTPEKCFMHVSAPSGAKIRAFDLYGNMMPSGPEVSLELGRLPQYLEWKGLNAEAAAKSIADAPYHFENDFRADKARIFNRGGNGEIIIFLKNTSVHNSAGEKSRTSSLFLAGEDILLPAVEAMKSAAVAYPVKIRADAPEEIEFKFSIDRAGKKFERMLTGHVANVLEIFEGNYSPPIMIARTVAGKTDSPDDLSAHFSAKYEGGDLLLSVHVRDNARCQPVQYPWEEDCIEIFIDEIPLPTAPQTDYQESFQSGTYQLCVAPWREEKLRVSAPQRNDMASNVKANVTTHIDGYDAEIRIPLGKRLGKLDGKMIGFDIAIDDSDAAKRKSQTVWNGTDRNHHDRSGFGALKFNPSVFARLDLVGSPKIRMKFGEFNGKSNSPYLKYADWMKDDRDTRLVTSFPVNPDWTEYSFTFTPQETGTVQIVLMREKEAEVEDKKWCSYDDIQVAGAILQNGDFERLKSDGSPEGWSRSASAVVESGEDKSHGGITCVKVNHDNRFSQAIAVKAGELVKIKFWSRAEK